MAGRRNVLPVFCVLVLRAGVVVAQFHANPLEQHVSDGRTVAVLNVQGDVRSAQDVAIAERDVGYFRSARLGADFERPSPNRSKACSPQPTPV